MSLVTAPLCVGCSGQCLYRSVVGCCPQETLKACLHPHIMMFHPMFMVPCPEAPLTPSPSPQETLKVCLHPHIMMFHPMFMVPCPEAPLTPSPLTPCPSPQETLKVCFHPINMMFHPMFTVPCPEAPLNPKSPNPLSQPPKNPKGVLVPKHHDVPPTHHFFLFFKGCTATSDGILASHL